MAEGTQGGGYSRAVHYMLCLIALGLSVSSEAPINNGRIIGPGVARGLPLNRRPFVFSHNAATGYLQVPESTTGPFVYGYVKNQRGTFTDQLNCGARALDLEFQRNEAGEILFAHYREITEVTVQAGFDEIKEWSEMEGQEEELVLLSIDTWVCDGCMQEISSMLSVAGIPLIEDCSTFGTLTVQGALEQYGNVLAASKLCFEQNYDESLSCHGFLDSSDPNNVQAVRDCMPAELGADISVGTFTQIFDCLSENLTPEKVQVYDCWADSDTTNVPFERLMSHLDTIARDVGAPGTDLLWQWQGLWQGNEDAVLLGLYRPFPLPHTVFGLEPSSILMDVDRSKLNQRVLSLVWELVQEGVTLNLVEVDDVCDDYASQLKDVLEGGTPDIEETSTPDIEGPSTQQGIEEARFEGVTYDEVPATRSFRGIPRFGHTDQFSEAFGSKDERNDYILGLLFAGTFVLAIFLAWLILLPIFMCLGRDRIGFLSGSAFIVPQESKKPKVIRIIFILAAVVVLVFSVLLVTEGITKLHSTVDTVYDGTVAVNSLLTETKANVDILDMNGKSAASLRDEVIASLEGDFCPNGDLTGKTGTDFDAISQQVVNFLNDLGQFSDEEVDDLREGLEAAVSLANDVESTTEEVKANDWQSLIHVFIIPLPIFCVSLVGGAVLAWLDHSNKWVEGFISWVILPLFVLWVILCCVLAGASAIAASSNADFCSGGKDKTPESTVQDIMRISDVDETEMLYKTIDYYIHQCDDAKDPLGFLYEYEDELDRAHSEVTKLDAAITDTTVEEIIAICGDQKYHEIAQLVSTMKDQANALLTAAGKSDGLLACENYAPIFTKTVYDGTCTLSVKGFTWTFSSLFIIGFMGLLLITFRSALRPIEYLTEDLDFKERAPMESYAQDKVVPHDGEEGVAMGATASGTKEEYEEDKVVPHDGEEGVAMGAAASGTKEEYEEDKVVPHDGEEGVAMGAAASGTKEEYEEVRIDYDEEASPIGVEEDDNLHADDEAVHFGTGP